MTELDKLVLLRLPEYERIAKRRGDVYDFEFLLAHSLTDSYLLGFDAASGGDKFDFSALLNYFGIRGKHWNSNAEAVIRPYKYMDSECKKLIDQLIEKQEQGNGEVIK